MQNLHPLSETTSIPVCFIWESLPPGLNCRIVYSSGHQGAFNPAVLKSKEVHMVHGNINTIKEVITLCKLILVNLANSAAGERSFSTVRRLKTNEPGTIK